MYQPSEYECIQNVLYDHRRFKWSKQRDQRDDDSPAVVQFNYMDPYGIKPEHAQKSSGMYSMEGASTPSPNAMFERRIYDFRSPASGLSSFQITDDKVAEELDDLLQQEEEARMKDHASFIDGPDTSPRH